MTVAELIEWLKTQPQEALVAVNGMEYGDPCSIVFDPEQHAHVHENVYESFGPLGPWLKLGE